MALYDPIATLYDPWSASVTEDIDFYVEEALASGGPVVELAVGTGRIAVPVAKAGIDVVGIDESEAMLDVARAFAATAGVTDRLELRLGDMRTPPVDGPAALVMIPFRSLLHMADPADKAVVLRAAAGLLDDDGVVVFDVFSPSPEDIAETDGRWLEREPGIHERADWDSSSQTLTLSVRSSDSSVSFTLHWLSFPEWGEVIQAAGLEISDVYGWFDRRPYAGGEDMIFRCRPQLGSSSTEKPGLRPSSP